MSHGEHGSEGGDCCEGHEEPVESDTCLVGGLIVRGNRCVLIRSLSGEWEGMRLPWGAADRAEPAARAAVRIVSELCEIEEDEVVVLNDVAPVTVAVPGMPISLHALYAASPPPASSADEDCEDPEDIYDWYTFPRAMAALEKDIYARAALATMACALAAGVLGGLVPKKWGGVFGQEWTTPALRMVPGPGLEMDETESKADTGPASSSSSGAAERKRKREAADPQAEHSEA
mmetsp:Transcript_45158/g.84278  ORF Transcript_45158/g.84278 Transcript_45158/m.84278 type:complete len:232 (-) Transcript_45158:7-702(-)